MIIDCKHKKLVICDTEVCPTCYYNELMYSKDRAPRLPKLEVVWDETKHMRIPRKVK